MCGSRRAANNLYFKRRGGKILCMREQSPICKCACALSLSLSPLNISQSNDQSINRPRRKAQKPKNRPRREKEKQDVVRRTLSSCWPSPLYLRYDAQTFSPCLTEMRGKSGLCTQEGRGERVVRNFSIIREVQAGWSQVIMR